MISYLLPEFDTMSHFCYEFDSVHHLQASTSGRFGEMSVTNEPVVESRVVESRTGICLALVAHTRGRLLCLTDARARLSVLVVGTAHRNVVKAVAARQKHPVSLLTVVTAPRSLETDARRHLKVVTLATASLNIGTSLHLSAQTDPRVFLADGEEGILPENCLGTCVVNGGISGQHGCTAVLVAAFGNRAETVLRLEYRTEMPPSVRRIPHLVCRTEGTRQLGYRIEMNPRLENRREATTQFVHRTQRTSPLQNQREETCHPVH